MAPSIFGFMVAQTSEHQFLLYENVGHMLIGSFDSETNLLYLTPSTIDPEDKGLLVVAHSLENALGWVQDNLVIPPSLDGNVVVDFPFITCETL